MFFKLKKHFSGKDARIRMNLISGLVLLIVILEVINSYAGHRFNSWGINPALANPFPGIFRAPFLHATYSHAILNASLFLVLGWLVSLRGVGKFLMISFFIVLLGGLGVWLFGRVAYHIGASGLVFGYFGFLVAIGLFERQKESLFIAFLVLPLYGGVIIGILPSETTISWEMHLFGLLAGILAAWVWTSPAVNKRKISSEFPGNY